jgi:hypothetical protein
MEKKNAIDFLQNAADIMDERGKQYDKPPVLGRLINDCGCGRSC